MREVYRTRRDRVRRDIAEMIKTAREALGLSRRQVAARMGYSNLDKGCARIAHWEKGAKSLRGDRPKVLALALDLPPTTLTDLVNREEEILAEAAQADATRRAHDAGVIQKEIEALATQIDGLLGSLESLQRVDAAMNARVLGAAYAGAFIGAGAISLGALLRAWWHGAWTLPCDCCGQTAYVYKASGSPLSGANSVHGFCRENPTPRRVYLPTGLTFLQFLRDGMDQGIGGGPDASAACWSVGDVLAGVGLGGVDVGISRPGGAPVAVWSDQHQRLTLETASTPVYFPRIPPSDQGPDVGEPQWRPTHGPAREGGRVVIGALTPLRFGAWRGDRLALANGDGRGDYATAGHLLAKDGTPLLVFEGTLPSRVIRWLCTHRTEAGEREKR